MKESARLFLVQAQSAFVVFELLRSHKAMHHCHSLHYLQMATELFAKAFLWERGPIRKTHEVIDAFFKRLATQRRAQSKLGFDGLNENWQQTLKKAKEIASEIQALSPAIAKNGPNAEYPWPPAKPIAAPVEYEFPVWTKLTATSFGRKYIHLLKQLLAGAGEYL
ncbi:MAG: hypothetical protein K2X38_09615 [Gemmataceae bacterium]|nr:hypothetical protein [Gemmataceae bacterium]